MGGAEDSIPRPRICRIQGLYPPHRMQREERIVSDPISRRGRLRKGFKVPVEFDAAHETSRGIRMSWGLQNRLSRIIRPTDGHTVMLAADHGYFLGPTNKLEIPRKTLEPLLPYADAVMVTRGVVRTSIDPGANVPIVLRVSGGASVLNEDLSNEKITTSMKEAVRLNASAVALSIFVGAAHEHDSLVNLGKLVDEGEDAGVPVLAVTAVGKELEKRDARYLGLACRIASEFGAHFVKTYYCDDFSKVVESCPVPLVVAGGPKLETELDALELAYDAIQDGAKGVDMGRNIWQSTNPVGMIRGIRAVVHERATPKEALEVVKGAKPKK